MKSISKVIYLVLLLLCIPLVSHAEVSLSQTTGVWYQLSSETIEFPDLQQIQSTTHARVDNLSLTGGRYLWQGVIDIQESGQYVIDFKSSSIIANFQHYILDDSNQLVAHFDGGIESDTYNPYFLRHGRQVELLPGQYSVLTIIDSPFYIGQPQPFITPLTDYVSGIKPANAMVLMCMGIYIGLGIYYLTLGLVRVRIADGMYVIFILGNMLFGGVSLLVFKELFGFKFIYALSFPILLSNMAYVAFVMSLLNINKTNYKKLFNSGRVLYLLYLLFFTVALIKPNWSLELARYGVGLFLVYGLMAGITAARRGNETARMYLIAISSFFLFGGLSISLSQVQGSNYFYIEHMGMLAVTIEVMLLALVLAHQFAEIYREKEFMQSNLEKSRRMAYTDALTGLPNRYALDNALAKLPPEGSLTFIDLDRLKYYNDRYGHARGDELLCNFASSICSVLNDKANVFRISGDEFAVISPSGDIEGVESAIDAAIALLHQCDFKLVGASRGSAYVRETETLSDFKHLADMRMYDNKKSKHSEPLD